MNRPFDPIAARSGARRRWRAVAATVLVAVALAGCNRTREPDVTGSVANDYRLRHPIAIREGNRAVEIFVGVNRGGLTPQQRADVLAFAHAWRREATGGIVVDAPAGTPNELAGAEVTREVRSILAAAGVPAQAIELRPYRPRDPAKLATVRLNYGKMTAETGPCGLWPEDLGPTWRSRDAENRPYHNFGCATQRNLAAMVDNPADLVQPRGESAAYAARRSTVLEKYRKGESPATVYPDANKGKISDVGQ